MTSIDTTGIRELCEKAIKADQAAREFLAKAAGGEQIPRSDGTTYSYKDDPIRAFEQLAESAAKARGAAEMAHTLLGQLVEPAGTLYEAARHLIAYETERGFSRGVRYGDAIRESLNVQQNDGRMEFLRDLMFEIKFAERKRDERVELEARKFAELIDAEGDWRSNVPGLDESSVADNLFRQLRTNALLVLTSPELRGRLEDQELAQLQHPFGYSPEYVRQAVQQDLDAEQAAKRAEYEAAQQKRQAKNATRCNGRVRGGVYGSQCDKAGRYVVTFAEDFTTYDLYTERGRKSIDKSAVRLCGTHLNMVAKDYRGGWRPGVLKVVDTKSDTVVYEKEEAKVG